MGGPEMAPQSPRRSERPGEAGALLFNALTLASRQRRSPTSETGSLLERVREL
jgi:hypothetical protein